MPIPNLPVQERLTVHPNLIRACGGDPGSALVLQYLLDVAPVHAGVAWPVLNGHLQVATGMPRKRCRTAIVRLRNLGFLITINQVRVGLSPGKVTHVQIQEAKLAECLIGVSKFQGNEE